MVHWDAFVSKNCNKLRIQNVIYLQHSEVLKHMKLPEAIESEPNISESIGTKLLQKKVLESIGKKTESSLGLNSYATYLCFFLWFIF